MSLLSPDDSIYHRFPMSGYDSVPRALFVRVGSSVDPSTCYLLLLQWITVCPPVPPEELLGGLKYVS